MKTRLSMRIGAITLFASLALPVRLAAQQHRHYKLIDIGTFGGPSSYLNTLADGGFFSIAKVLNRHRIVAGWADTSTVDPFASFCFNPDCFVSHAFQWQNGVKTDLGALANGWSSAATWINDNGEIVGFSQNSVNDPLIGFPETRAVLWRNGQIIDLGTLEGNQSAALGVNNHGQVAGLALNTTPDSFSIYDLLLYGSSNGTQTRAVLWDRDGGVQDLGTLGGPDAYALLVNEHGQVAGWSYTDSTPNATTGLPTGHPYLWDKEKGMQDLGTLGGTLPQSVNGLNERGEVVGSTTLAGDLTHHAFLWNGKSLIDLGTLGGENAEADWVNDAEEVVGIAQYTVSCPNGLGGAHGFLWKNGVMNDLGSTDGLANSEAVFINSRAQVVGYSFACDFSVISAFLWEKGSIVDLNTLISPKSRLQLALATYIDDRGEITALGVLPNGDVHAVLLVPCQEGDEDCMDSAVHPTTARNSILTLAQHLAIRRMMTGPRRRLGPLSRIPGLGASPKD